MRVWLREIQSDLSGAYLSGSVLDLAAHLADVDLVLVAIDDAGEPGSHRARTLRTAIAPASNRALGLPLSGMVEILSEKREIDCMIVRERKSLLSH